MKENRTSNKSTFIVLGITFVIVGILAAVKVIRMNFLIIYWEIRHRAKIATIQ